MRLLEDCVNELVCERVSVFATALTRGKRYPPIQSDEARRQVKVKGDNGTTCWFLHTALRWVTSQFRS